MLANHGPSAGRACRRLLLLASLLAAVAGPGPVSAVAGQEPAEDVDLLDEVEAMARLSSVVGREGPARAFVRERLAGLPVREDSLGNLVLTLGSGEPRRLLAAPLDEPGLVVSRVRDDGYLRLTPLGQGYRGNLAHQYLEGQEVTIVTARGRVHGASTVPSAHLTSFARERPRDWPPFAWQDAWVDVGAESRVEVAELGIELVDPVTLVKRPVRLPDRTVAAPAAQRKAAAVALTRVARRLAVDGPDGTVVLAWVALGLLNGKGLEAVVEAEGPFAEAWVASSSFGYRTEPGRGLQPAWLPPPGSGALVAGPDPVPGAVQAPHVASFRHPTTGGPAWRGATVRYVGVPTRYQDTPVELVHAGDVESLAALWVRIVGGNASAPATVPPLAPAAESVAPGRGHEAAAEMLASLVARYGVSGAEGPVRDRVTDLLPAWATPETDEIGNLWISFGEGPEHVIFVAHMDETGCRVSEIRDDGRLVLGGRAGLDWVWEAQAAVVHTAAGDLPAVFEPRPGAFDADRRQADTAKTVYLGVGSRADAKELGVEPGRSTVTMPKRMRRLGRHRAMARGFDDRAGSTALLLAAGRIDPSDLPRRVTFAWSVQEEVGLHGAARLAERFPDADVVHPVDTFVSSDAPREARRSAHAPLGGGAVVRVLESINFAPRDRVRDVLELARARGIPVQLGMTSGGTDGQPFLANGTPSLPLSWPGRYSHSPVEVLDFRDLEALVDLITAVATRR